MDELTELHIKGKLSEKGYLKETYDNKINDLNHELTDKGRDLIRTLFKSNEYKKEFMKLAIEKAKKSSNPLIIKAAINAIKRYSC